MESNNYTLPRFYYLLLEGVSSLSDTKSKSSLIRKYLLHMKILWYTNFHELNILGKQALQTNKNYSAGYLNLS